MSGLGDSGHQHDQQDHEQQDEHHHLRRFEDLENLGRGFSVNKCFDCFIDIDRDKLAYKVRLISYIGDAKVVLQLYRQK